MLFYDFFKILREFHWKSVLVDFYLQFSQSYQCKQSSPHCVEFWRFLEFSTLIQNWDVNNAVNQNNSVLTAEFQLRELRKLKKLTKLKLTGNRQKWKYVLLKRLPELY